MFHRSMMSESRRSRRRTGFLLSRGCTTRKWMLLQRVTKKDITSKIKDTVKFERKIKVSGNLESRTAVKRARIIKNVFGDDDSAVDYISELPDTLIHNIMSFLHAREATRMSILSKKWRQVWCSFPQLDIDHRYFRLYGDDWIDELKNHVNSVLQNCALQRVIIDRFRLCVTRNPLVKKLIGTLIKGAMERNVKELHLQVRRVLFFDEPYTLPISVLSATTITVLILSGCNLETTNNIKLPLLQKLSLNKVHLSDRMLQNLICSCPLIEELRLIECMELQNVNISAPTKLQRFHLYQCEDLVNVKISAPMLRSIWIRQRSYGQWLDPHINLKGCISLRELVMECPNLVIEDFLELPVVAPEMTGSMLFDYKFHFIEKFVLRKGTFGSFMQLSAENLTKLGVIDCLQLVKLQICAPQLISLEYRGKDIPITLIGPTNLRDVKLFVKRADDGTEDCKYHELLRTLASCPNLKLLTWDKSEVTIQEDISRVFPPLSMGYNVRTIQLSTSINCLIESLLTRRKYPSRLSLLSHKDSKLHEAIYDKLNDGRENLNCCNYLNNKCWRHYLSKVTSKRSKAKWSEEFDNMDGTVQPKDDWLESTILLHWKTNKPC